MGFQVDSETNVQHLAAGDDKIASALAATLFGSVAIDGLNFWPSPQCKLCSDFLSYTLQNPSCEKW